MTEISTLPEGKSNDLNIAAVQANGGFEVMKERRPPGLLRRLIYTQWHLTALLFGAAYRSVRQAREAGQFWRLRYLILALLVSLAWPFMDRSLVRKPFPVQFRRRLERLGPTYIKLGQILSLRDDILPKSITDELKNLLDRLPAVSFERFKELISDGLGRDADQIFPWIEPVPLGSASLAQTHRARLVTGEEVVLKVLKPGVRRTVVNDTRLLRFFGYWSQLFLARYQPRRLINEFARYTRLELDLRNEADNAGTFQANFIDEPQIRFPSVYLEYCSEDVLCMEFFNGQQPSAAVAAQLSAAEKERIIDLGVGATVQMIFRDGFFHADLHPGNMIIFDDATVGFIDLGMIGRFDSEMQKKMLYYMFSLTNSDPVNAARYMVSLTIPGKKSDPDGFRRAVEDLNRRWLRSPNFEDFSLGQLILESISLAGRHRIRYPGELILMVKALVTVEGVGHLLSQNIDVIGAADKHVQKIVRGQFNIERFMQGGVMVLPELLDALYRAPLVLNESLQFAENRLKSQGDGPLAAVRGTLFAGFCLLAAAIVFAAGGHWLLWGGLFFIAFTIGGYTFLSRN